jgi:acetyl esterase/lipase
VPVLAAIVLLFAAMVGVVAVWPAVKPPADPTHRYSPSWLPAMIVTESAAFGVVVCAGLLVVGVVLGGASNPAGAVAAVVLVIVACALAMLLVRSHLAARRLRTRVTGDVPAARGVQRLTGRPVPRPPGVVVERAIEYAVLDSGPVTLDMIRRTVPRAEAPVVVYVHGGGWTGGDPQRQAHALYNALALDGWVVLTIRYPFTPHVNVEQQVDAVRAAVRWARDGLRAHNTQATTVVLAGGSAGGHLATLAAFTPTDDDERVDACVGMYAVYDLANRNRTRAHWTKVPEIVMRATVDDAPERYRDLSPLDRIHDATPPMLVVHGTHDTLVPIGEGEQFVDAMRAAGRPVEFVRVDGAQHAFDAFGAITGRTVAAVVRDWLNRAVQAPTA